MNSLHINRLEHAIQDIASYSRTVRIALNLVIEDVKGIHEMTLINQALPALKSAVNSVIHINNLFIQNVVDADCDRVTSSLSLRESFAKERDLGGVPAVCGVLPRRGMGEEWFSRALAVNSRLAAHYRCNAWLYIDNWDLFFDNDTLYARNGVHLSLREVEVLADSLERSLNTLQVLLV